MAGKHACQPMHSVLTELSVVWPVCSLHKDLLNIPHAHFPYAEPSNQTCPTNMPTKPHTRTRLTVKGHGVFCSPPSAATVGIILAWVWRLNAPQARHHSVQRKLFCILIAMMLQKPAPSLLSIFPLCKKHQSYSLHLVFTWLSFLGSLHFRKIVC
jgi:hypothetical protein